MDIKTQIVVSVTSYKIVSLLVGSAFAYMGYRLFISGIWGQAGNFETSFGDSKLVLRKAAPGTFFALFGAVIVSVTLYKGLDLKSHEFENKAYIDKGGVEDDGMPEKPPF